MRLVHSKKLVSNFYSNLQPAWVSVENAWLKASASAPLNTFHIFTFWSDLYFWCFFFKDNITIRHRLIFVLQSFAVHFHNQNIYSNIFFLFLFWAWKLMSSLRLNVSTLDEGCLIVWEVFLPIIYSTWVSYAV